MGRMRLRRRAWIYATGKGMTEVWLNNRRLFNTTDDEFARRVVSAINGETDASEQH